MHYWLRVFITVLELKPGSVNIIHIFRYNGSLFLQITWVTGSNEGKLDHPVYISNNGDCGYSARFRVFVIIILSQH